MRPGTPDIGDPSSRRRPSSLEGSRVAPRPRRRRNACQPQVPFLRVVVIQKVGEAHKITLTLRTTYARALFLDNGTALADLREAVSTLEDVSPIVRRVLGSAHPEVAITEKNLKASRAVLRAREASAGT